LDSPISNIEQGMLNVEIVSVVHPSLSPIEQGISKRVNEQIRLIFILELFIICLGITNIEYRTRNVECRNSKRSSPIAFTYRTRNIKKNERTNSLNFYFGTFHHLPWIHQYRISNKEC
jgi:hypothetical protein